ncbi:MAG: preprotein translocase subunit SecE [Glaciecola sp.]
MSTSENKSFNAADMFKWVISIALLIGTVAGNTYFVEESILVRAIAIVVTVIVALLIASTTEKGKNAVEFAKESRTEIRKVVWPSRQETRTTTLIVFAATIVVALLLYVLDLVIVEIVSFITGLGI